MKRSTLIGVVTLFAMSLSSGVQAASVYAQFDLRGSGPDVSSIHLSQGGLDLMITPDTIRNNGSLNGEKDIKLTRTNKGIGVDNRNCFWFICDGGQLDGFGHNDIALFEFSKAVTIESLYLLKSDRNDHMSLFGGANFDHLGRYHIPRSNIVQFSGIGEAMRTGSLFGVAAFDFNDDFRIAGISVSYDAVPIPAALPLMLTGLAGMGLWGRRKKRLSAAG